MAEVNYKIQEAKQKLAKKVYGIIFLVLLVAVGSYSYLNFEKYQDLRAQIKTDFVDSLIAKTASEKEIFDENEERFEDLSKEIEQNLTEIFPTSDNYTDVTRQMDALERELDTSIDPFEVSNISFQGAIFEEDYSVLPLRMNIRSSRKNFLQFMDKVENSGAIDGDLRLMDISSIRLNFENFDSDPGEQQIISFTVQVNAYFQKI